MPPRRLRRTASFSLRKGTLERLEEMCPEDLSVSAFVDLLLTEGLDKRALAAVDLEPPPDPDPLGLEAK